ncbi:hypothetical protein O181_033181 [Austropuccinia psidii MF-1]|uniref:Uncharacterized protein n=1 Tax=Austropuccinia psidii MF-1 TaxID=1389203 RepID=A0A9Q3H6U7_9BASI|nr:hypothetical protein [Austropuccinia psidii MF-1]
MRHTQILTPVQDPGASHAKPCTVPNNSNNCLRQGSLATAPTLPYAGAGAQRFTRKSLSLCRFLTIQTNANARAGFRQFTCKSLCLYRFLTLHTRNTDTCTGSRQFRPFLTPGQPPDNSKNSLHN